MKRSELAKEYFLKGYNCAQATLLAFKDLFPIDENGLAKLVSPLGGGIARLRETCGVITSISLVIGQVYGYSDASSDTNKQKTYQITQEILLKFEKEFGSLCCRDLLNKTNKHDTYIPSVRDANFYASRPCLKYIMFGVDLLDEYLKK